jgi:putative membrane protein
MTLHWHTEPLLLLVLLVPSWLYALWMGPYRPAGLRFPAGRVVAFYLGIAITYLTVGSPLDQLGEDYLFSAHMVQHLLLMYVSPVLLVVGLPPEGVDRLVAGRLRLQAVIRFFFHPVVAGFLFSLSFSLWHVPVLYEAALASKTIHVLEHWTIWFPSVGIAWCLFSGARYLPPCRYPVRLLLLFLLTVAQLPVFGVLTMTGEVLYPTYEWAPRLLPITALEDQVLGGLFMKVGGMFFVLPLLAYSFYRWAKTSEEEEEEGAGEREVVPAGARGPAEATL